MLLGTARGRIEAGGCCRGVCGGATEVGLVMILVGILVASGSKLMPVATLESSGIEFDVFCPGGSFSVVDVICMTIRGPETAFAV